MGDSESWSGTPFEPDAELDQLARVVVDAALEVHRTLGPGFLEAVYRDALCFELQSRGIAVEREKSFHVRYQGVAVGHSRLDLLVGGRLVMELKCVDALAPIHTAQVISYLKATGLTLALLINFNSALLRDGIKRVVRSRGTPQ